MNISIKELNEYAHNKENIIKNINMLEDEDIKSLNTKEDYESLIRHCEWIITDANKILNLLEKENGI